MTTLSMPATMTQLPKEIDGYPILSLIGEGAFSKIYAAKDPKTRQLLALKHVIINDPKKDERWVEQMDSETRIANALDHPVLRKVLHFKRQRRWLKSLGAVMLMEFVDGRTLDVIKPDVQETIRIFIELAEGLQHMEQQGFVHCDMKPINVLVTSAGDVKIIDLGQACEVGTIKKRIQGTPGYMAPEQAHRREITSATDVYNLGATMYWVLCGRVIPTALPPRGQSNGLTTGAVEERFLKPPVSADEINSEVPNIVAKTIQESVAPRPEDRISMSKFLERLQMAAGVLRPDDPDAFVV
jgi:serine/threonine protein kinase